MVSELAIESNHSFHDDPVSGAFPRFPKNRKNLIFFLFFSLFVGVSVEKCPGGLWWALSANQKEHFLNQWDKNGGEGKKSVHEKHNLSFWEISPVMRRFIREGHSKMVTHVHWSTTYYNLYIFVHQILV